MIDASQLEGLEFDMKTGGSNIDQCPGRHHVTVGGVRGYVVQGEPLSPDARAKLQHLGVTEQAVFVPADVIEG